MIHEIKPHGPFHQGLLDDLNLFLFEQKLRFPKDETLKIDMHCHDYNSDVPDEILGRILNLPETWLSTKSLLKHLKKADCDVVTITNHNNARSCFDLQEAGVDVLSGAEFSCTVPDFNIGIHVLVYGLNREDEKTLRKLRRNLYTFLRYTNDNDLPTVWAHPLYHYSKNGKPPISFFKKMTVVFQRFEVLNGQRDTWQNLLIKSWLSELTPQIIDEYALEANISPSLYCKNPYEKFMTGGSDSHMGFFAGLTGTYLHVPDLKNRLKQSKPSELALEAIREGRMAPYGSHQNSEKLTIAFLDYVCQIALNSKDPGLLRILTHNGTSRDKIIALLTSNAFAELQKHKVTLGFVDVLHNSFIGKKANFGKRFLIPKDYKGVFDEAQKIAEASKNNPKESVDTYRKSIYSINEKLNNLLFKRFSKKVVELNVGNKIEKLGIAGILQSIEIPSEIRSYIDKANGSKSSQLNGKDISKFLDGLSFPFLGSAILLAAHYTSARVMYSVRPLLQEFSEQLGKYEHPKRMLWMTDTFGDKNGVSTVLRSILEEIKVMNLPIDILICNDKIKPEDHLIVIKTAAEFDIPMYDSQPLRIPNFLEIHEL
ncbi:MAG: glycosyl transferase family 1, partial [Bacteroidota bacterium]